MLGIWLRMLAASLQAQMGYRASFLLEVLGRFMVTLSGLLGVFVLFSHIDGLGGWSKWEVVYLYGIASMSLGLAELLTDGLNDMADLVRTGTFDGMLTRPVPTLVQVLGRQCRPLHLGRAAQGLLAIILALAHLELDLGPAEAAMMAINVVGSIGVYAGIFIAGGAALIFTVESAEAFNAFTYGGAEMTQYPLTIYERWMRRPRPSRACGAHRRRLRAADSAVVGPAGRRRLRPASVHLSGRAGRLSPAPR